MLASDVVSSSSVSVVSVVLATSVSAVVFDKSVESVAATSVVVVLVVS